jgi:hypothetical protein
MCDGSPSLDARCTLGLLEQYGFPPLLLPIEIAWFVLTAGLADG